MGQPPVAAGAKTRAWSWTLRSLLMGCILTKAAALCGGDSLPDFTRIDPATLRIKPVTPTKDPKTGFIIGGKNPTVLIPKLTEINGIKIQDLEADMRPGKLSRLGFLGKDEKLVEVLAADNRFVVDEKGLTHQEIARHLHILGAIRSKLKSRDKKSEPFLYHGRRYQVELLSTRGFVDSPFQDDTKGDRVATLYNLDNSRKLQFALLVPHMIERYGFYEGKGTPYRVAPERVLEVLDFLSAKKSKQGTPVCLSRIGGDFIQHLSWSPDGKLFLFTRIRQGKMGLWTMAAASGALKRLLPAEPMPHFDGHWSPDAKKIVFVFDRLQGTDGQLQIDVMNADGSERKNLLPHVAFEESPRWSPDGKHIAWVSTREKNQEIHVASADGKNMKRLTNSSAADNAPAWSPDGKQIAFTSGRSGNLEIFLMNVDGANVRRLTSSPTMDYWPVFSPDGKCLAFTSNRDGNYEIYVMNIDGSGQRNLTRHPAQDNFPTWSPDGRRLAFISNRGGSYEIYAVELK